MSVSINISSFLPTQQALANNFKQAALSATKMSTGNAIVNAAEDPTALTIGSTMESRRDVLEVVAKGLAQSKSMLNVAERAARDAYKVIQEIKKVLGGASRSDIGNDVLQSALAPTFNQLTAEMDRIAKGTEFNGQNLFDGTSGKSFSGVPSTYDSSQRFIFNSSSVGLATIGTFGTLTADVTKADGTTLDNATVAFTSPSGILITGGQLVHDTVANKIILKNATLSFAATSTVNTSTITDVATRVTVSDVNITMNNLPSDIKTDGSLTDEATNSTISFNANTKFSITDTAGALQFQNENSTRDTNGVPTVATTAGRMSVTNVKQLSNRLEGGVGATSTFNFLVGPELAEDIIGFALPVLTLESMIKTANVEKFAGGSKPTALRPLQTKEDVVFNIGLVDAIEKQLLVAIGNIAAFETRTEVLNEQLDNYVNQLQLAAEVITRADLSKETAKFAQASAQGNIAISVLQQLTQSMKALERIVA